MFTPDTSRFHQETGTNYLSETSSMEAQASLTVLPHSVPSDADHLLSLFAQLDPGLGTQVPSASTPVGGISFIPTDYSVTSGSNYGGAHLPDVWRSASVQWSDITPCTSSLPPSTQEWSSGFYPHVRWELSQTPGLIHFNVSDGSPSALGNHHMSNHSNGHVTRGASSTSFPQLEDSSKANGMQPPLSPDQSLVPLLLPPASTFRAFLSLIHQKRRRERNLADVPMLRRIFEGQSLSLDTDRCALFKTIPRSEFYRNHELEPNLGTPEACAILSAAGTPGLAYDAPKEASIFSLFLNLESNTCRICEKSYGTLERALGCVRRDFCHRPFACGGEIIDCNACSISSPARFFTLSGLRDHLCKQKNLDRCPIQNCNAIIRIGEIPRHYKAMHRSEPLPDMKLERERSRGGSMVQRSPTSTPGYSPY
ncbi:hypothetical protein FRC17_006068 [Serendipita sp. 399]|nr:hypothetical protein FRC17_006068 [Serendipita sp. 399]